MNLNKVVILGRVTQDPELRNTPSGTSVCSFSVATNRVWNDKQTGKKQQDTEFHNVVAWRRLGEIASQYLSKGSLVLVEGRLQTRKWEDSSGNTRQRTEIVADNIQLPPKSMGSAETTPTRRPKKKKKVRSKDDIPVIEEDEEMAEDEEDIDVDEIPF